jgi:hypothetical protein
MAQVLGAMSDVSLRRQLFDKIDRARDIHALKAPLKRSVAALLTAYEQENDPDLRPPAPESFKGLLRFLSHSYRADWEPPAVGVNPEGRFLAIWDIGPNRYSVEFLDRNSANWTAVFRELDGVKVQKGAYSDFEDFSEPPFQIPRSVAA